MAVIGTYDGPLGALEPELRRRKIAVGVDERGQICLVRPDSVVLEFDDDGVDAVRRDVVDAEDFEVLGGPPAGRPQPGLLGARRAPSQRGARTWGTDEVNVLMERLQSDHYVVRPNHVYLAGGVTRHYGIVDDGRSTGTPGFHAPADVASTVRPAAPPPPFPARLELPGRRRPNVLVLDSGLRRSGGAVEHPALDNCAIHEDWLDASLTRFNDDDEPDDDGRGRLDAQAGHGTFISGIIRRSCPDAVVHTRGVLTSYGDGDDASIDASIKRALATVSDGIDVVVMSFGTYGDNDEPTPAMRKAVSRLPGSSVIVAAAGNDGTSRRYFPAALPGVVGVGALDGGGRAAFSNFGPWVDACAPGVDVVSTFFCDFDETDVDGGVTARWRGWANWSGTSFAAPVVGGLIAQRMYLDESPAPNAWARLQASATMRLPGLGAVFNS